MNFPGYANFKMEGAVYLNDGPAHFNFTPGDSYAPPISQIDASTNVCYPIQENQNQKEKKTLISTTAMKICEWCKTTNTPEWRRGPQGPHTLCNACGLRYAKKFSNGRLIDDKVIGIPRSRKRPSEYPEKRTKTKVKALVAALALDSLSNSTTVPKEQKVDKMSIPFLLK